MPQRDSVRYTVFRDGLQSAQLEVLDMAESAGGSRLDYATLEYKGASIEDIDISNLANDQIEIVWNDSGTYRVAHWGKVSLVDPFINPQGETLRVVSRTEPFHLGQKLDGYYVHDPLNTTHVLIDGDLVFNPLIDGKIVGNLHDTLFVVPNLPIFLDPESVRTAASQTLQGGNVELWPLAKAVYYLLWALNEGETYAVNPTLATLEAVFNDPTALVQDVRIPRGTYLAKALDMLLEPLGYHWRIAKRNLEAGEIAEVLLGQLAPNSSRRTFQFFKKGSGGSVVTVNHQRYGANLNTGGETTNVEVSGVRMDTAVQGNEITVRGGFGEYEITVELLRAWPTADDPASGVGDEYDREHADFADVQNVMRKWVLNEAGDYIGLRAEIDGIFTSTLRTALDGLGLLEHFIPRRRKFMPTLTLNDDGDPIGTTDGVEIEWSNTSSPDWKPAVNMGCQLLQKECGVYFDGKKLPEQFLEDPANTRVRVTATIQSDYRLTGFIARQANSPQDDVVPLVLDLPQRFRFRSRHSSLATKYGGGATPSNAVDDSTEIQDFAEYCREVWDLMDVGGAIQLEGLDNSYEVGQRVSGVQYKNVSFEARAASGAYPQIVAIQRSVNQQTTTLHLERQLDPLALPAVPRAQRRAQA